MRVALVNPPWMYKRLYTHGIYPPYGILMLATQLREHGHDAQILDANALEWTEEETRAQIAAFDPDVLGITVFTDGFGFAERTGPWWKRHSGGKPLLIGGPLVSGAPETLLKASRADVATIGESFVSGPQLIAALEKGTPLSEVAGLILQHADGTLQPTGPTPAWGNLDTLPLPDWELLLLA